MTRLRRGIPGRLAALLALAAALALAGCGVKGAPHPPSTSADDSEINDAPPLEPPNRPSVLDALL